ncbi:serine protease inhibitor 88Ea-like [Macrosteles quadrilineatus]|uniref:serine protease inhibitor 88Ea-like n=1 Tax=Macrosteles quadrilineatus TaxID=74068 RepID=UPI0023E17363|nr:serine protease inhibitor 88Ea-like [Macrosteles quadrilineatus]
MLVIAACLVALPLVRGQCFSPEDTPAGSAPAPLYTGQLDFALSMLQSLNSLEPQANLFFSPLSVYSTLLLAYFVSSNHTEGNLHKALYLPENMTKVQVLEAYKAEWLLDQMRAMNSSDSYQLINANHLFVSQNLEVRECMQTLFQQEMEKLDFEGDVNTATDHINSWVSNHTRGHIQQLIPAGRLSPTAKLVLANAAYFKGLWKSRFLPAKSKKETFFISSTEKSLVTMMRQKGTFNHLVSEALGAHVLQLPYKGSAISMFVFLPPYAAPRGVANILRRLTPHNLREILSEDAMVPREVEVGMPKFSVESSLELVPILATLGVGDLFNASADLSELTGSPGIQLDDAVHKAKIQVDEEGTTAAAATAFFTFRSSRPLDVAMFICNHPFVYLLYDAQSQTILFTGVYSSPPPSS